MSAVAGAFARRTSSHSLTSPSRAANSSAHVRAAPKRHSWGEVPSRNEGPLNQLQLVSSRNTRTSRDAERLNHAGVLARRARRARGAHGAAPGVHSSRDGVVAFHSRSARGERELKRSRTRPTAEPKQRHLQFPQHGGARKGAGRKPKGKRAGPSHAARPSTPARHPLLVTQRLCAGLPSLRHRAELEVIRGAIAESAQRDGFRIVHFSIQSNHLHSICEARDARCLTSGMRSLAVKIAVRLNALWKHAGQVFAERFHARALETPSEVRNALAYVLNNACKHGIFADAPDPFSSGPWFDGWDLATAPSRHRAVEAESARQQASPTAIAQTWLLRSGWRRGGLLDMRVVPGGKAAMRAQARAEALAADSIRRSLAAAALSTAERGVERAASVSRRTR
jgi:REP element-mobilizing transposase RayT